MRRFLTLTVTALACGLGTPGLARPISADDARLAPITAGLKAHATMPGLVARVGERFLGAPYIAGLLDVDGTPAQDVLTSRLAAFDCVTFVETSVAIARAIAAGNATYAGFRDQLEHLRYRDGVRKGYASRLHYFSEWIADNDRRGLVQDLTPSLGGVLDGRTIDFMSTHRKAYKKLADPQAFKQIEAVEAALKHQKRYMIPKDRVQAVLPLLETGDVVAITTNIQGLDVVHTGLIYREKDGSVHLLHAPEPGSAVQISQKPLTEYLQGYKAHTGIMIARPLAP